MSEIKSLPMGWEMSQIGQVCEPSQYGYTAKAASNGNYHYLRTTDITKSELNWENVPFCEISDGEAEKYLLKDNDVVISRAGSIGYSYLISKARKSVFASYLIRFRPLLNPKYFRYFLDTQQYWDAISEGSSGIAVQNVNAKTLSLIDLPIAPEKEQTEIVEKLDEAFSDLDAGVKELKTAQTKLTQYTQSLFKSAMAGSFTKKWREKNNDSTQETGQQLLERILIKRREQWQQKKLEEFKAKDKTPSKGWQDKYPEPIKPDITDLPELPEGWVWASLSQIGWLDRGKSKHRPRNAEHLYGGDYPFVQTGEIRSAEQYIKKTNKTYSEDGLKQSKLWPKGTMCITIAANIGETAILGIEACFPDSIVGFSTIIDDMPIEYVEYVFRVLKHKLNDEAPATAQKNINLEILSKEAIPLPPVKEQLTLVEMLTIEIENIKHQKNATALGLKQSEAQRKNILKSAFSGQLVPQVPSYEPATVLLEKIQKEREKLAKAAKSRNPSQSKKKVNVMDTLLKVLTSEDKWLDAQDAFRKCGVVNNTSTDEIEKLYLELRELVAKGLVEVLKKDKMDKLRIIKK